MKPLQIDVLPLQLKQLASSHPGEQSHFHQWPGLRVSIFINGLEKSP